MLTPLHSGECAQPSVDIQESAWPIPFAQGLEYSPPARGPWTIVHVGMLIPQSHEIFVCAAGCLRGVVLSAAEMGLQKRFSTITVTEEHLRDGDLENTMIEGVSHILASLTPLPRAVLLYSSCLHHFAGCDLSWVYRTLSERFPQVTFTDAYMTPTLRKSEMPPDNKMRRQLYHGLQPLSAPSGGLLLAGILEKLSAGNEFERAAAQADVTLYELASMTSYDEYLAQANATRVVTINPAAKEAGTALSERHAMHWEYLPLAYDEDEIDQHILKLCALMAITPWDTSCDKALARNALEKARIALDGRCVAICQTATTRPLSLALRLLDAGIRVSDLYCDSFMPADRLAFDTLRLKAPHIRIHPTITPIMRFSAPATKRDDIVAIGQRAAFFTGATHMVNLLEGGPFWGHSGMTGLAQWLEKAAQHPVDVDSIISVKGWGCMGC